MVLIKAIADDIEGAGMHVIEVRRLGDEISPYKITTFPLTFQIIPQLFILNHDFFILNQYSPYKKRRSPALNHFALGCQRRVALPTQTKDYPRIVTNCL